MDAKAPPEPVEGEGQGPPEARQQTGFSTTVTLSSNATAALGLVRTGGTEAEDGQRGEGSTAQEANWEKGGGQGRTRGPYSDHGGAAGRGRKEVSGRQADGTGVREGRHLKGRSGHLLRKDQGGTKKCRSKT